MLLDAIFLIPTLFTYCLILLLICILCFIVVYISHKIYISIYDNLPLGTISDGLSQAKIYSSALRMRSEAEPPSISSIWIQNRSQIYHSNAVRFVLSLESCYLACLELNVPATSKERPISFICDCRNEQKSPSEPCAATMPREFATHIVKYYDQLTKIPRVQVMMKCTQRSMDSHISSNMKHMLDDVIMDVVDAQCTDNAAACRPSTSRKKQAAARQE